MFFLGKIAAAVFAWGAYVVLRLAGWKRKTVLANAKHVTMPVDYNVLLKNLTRHASKLLFCFGTFKRLPADFSKYPCCVDGWTFDLAEGSLPVLEKMRNGGIFLTAHYGNYEAMGPWLCCLGIPLVASYIPVKPKWLNNILERKIRAVDGRSYSVDARTPRDFLRILNEGNLFCLLADQDSRIPSALPGTFLGRPANVNPLPDFLLKHRPQTPVFICWMEERRAFSGGAFSKGASPSERRKVRVLHAIEVPRQSQTRLSNVASPAHSSPSIANSAQSESASPAHSSPSIANSAQSESASPAHSSSSIANSAQFDVASPAHSSPSVVNVQFNKWLEERIAENPNLWYGFTHRRFYSQSPTIY